MRLRLAVTIAAALGLAPLARAATLEVRGPQDGGFITHVVSVREARYVTTLHQQYDFSCGSAAVATLLTYQYGQAVNENEVFAFMFEHGDQAKIRKEGFSMLDMKHYLASRGFAADGFQQPVERLAQEKLPAIVLLRERGYRHFVVVKGVGNGRVLVGDPAMGTRAISMEHFQRLWVSGILFVVHNRRENARFNLAADWHNAPGAPLDQAIDRQRLLDTLPLYRAGAY